MLRTRGLLTSNGIAAQAREAQAIINRYGILREQNIVQPSHWTMSVPQAIAVTYANSYARAGVQENLCDYSFGATGADGNALSLAANAEAILFGTSTGLPPTGGVNIIDNASRGGPRQNTLSVSPSGVLDQNLEGALCLWALWTGDDPASGRPLTGALLDVHRRLHRGIGEIPATADLNGTPSIIVQGRADAVVHPNHAGRAYYARNKQIESRRSRLSYVEATNAQHLDALNSVPGLDSRFVSLHYCFNRAMDLMYRHLKEGRDLPPSQVVHAVPRGGTPGQAPAITTDNLPPIRQAPADADRITFIADVLTIPE